AGRLSRCPGNRSARAGRAAGFNHRNVLSCHRRGGRMTETPHPTPPPFDAEFREAFRDLVRWRRDVRRFRREAVDPALIGQLLELASHAPSVGHCQPWRFVLVESAERRELIKSSFARANAQALENYYGEPRGHYAR